MQSLPKPPDGIGLLTYQWQGTNALLACSTSMMISASSEGSLRSPSFRPLLCLEVELGMCCSRDRMEHDNEAQKDQHAVPHEVMMEAIYVFEVLRDCDSLPLQGDNQVGRVACIIQVSQLAANKAIDLKYSTQS